MDDKRRGRGALPRYVEHDGPAEQQLLDPLLYVHLDLERHVDEVAVQDHLYGGIHTGSAGLVVGGSSKDGAW